MAKHKRASGNTLVMVLVVLGVVVLAIAFFAINYHQTIGTQTEAQTAIDAAALQAAKDIGRVVINGHFGKVALVDDVPPNNDYTLRNVLGINSILATIRLDLIIANKLGNTTMIYAAKQQLANAAADADALTTAIQGAASGTQPAYDKNGTPIDIAGDVLNAYNSNSRRLGNTNKSLVKGSLKFAVGQLSSGIGRTNVPTPQPAGDDPPTQSSTYAANDVYKPYVAVPTPGSDVTITFVSSGAQPALAANTDFNSTLQSGIAPAVVQVSADEQVQSLAPSGQGGQATSTVHVVSTAHCGGQRYSVPSGGFYIAFPDGFPQGQGISVDFTSVQSIMNSSMLPASASSGTGSPFNGWSGQNDATYGLDASNGNVSSQAYLGRQNDDPAVALSIMTFNWLFSLGLRPNIDAVAHALATPLQNYGNGAQPGNSMTISANFNPAGALPAVANTSDAPAVVPYVHTTDPVTGRDRRLLVDNKRPENNQRMLDGFMQEGPQAIGLLSRAPIFRLDSKGHVESNTPLVVQRRIVKDNNLAGAAHASALSVIKEHLPVAREQFQKLVKAEPGLDAIVSKKTSRAELTQMLDRIAAQSDELSELRNQYLNELRILARAQNVRVNAMKVAGLTEWMLNNYTRLCGPECRVILAGKVSSLTGLMVHHFNKSPTANDIASGVNLPGGQDSGGDWGSTTLDYVRGRTFDVIANNKPDSAPLVPPARADNTIPAPQKYQFYFTLQGDATAPNLNGGGQVLLTLSPFGVANPPGPINGQIVYQNPQAVSSPYPFLYLAVDPGLNLPCVPTITNDFMKVEWQAIGWNNDSYFTTDSAFYNTEGVPPSTGAPSAVKPVVEFWFRCPVGVCSSPVYQVYHPAGGFIAWDFWYSGNIAPEFNATLPWGNDNSLQLLNWMWYWHKIDQSQIDQMNQELQMVQQGGCEIIPETII